MPDWVYCGTDQQVGAAETLALLVNYNAAWCSPPNLRAWPAAPAPAAGDRLWLVWTGAGAPPVLLGGGRILANAQPRYGTALLWTNTDIPGVTQYAMIQGYGGGTGMSFLRLGNVVACNAPFPNAPQLQVSPSWNFVGPAIAAQLAAMLQIP